MPFATGWDPTQGALTATGRDLDVGINGAGWIAVLGKDGREAYTRAGDLHVAQGNAGVEHGGDEGVSEHVRVHPRQPDARRCGEAPAPRIAGVALGAAGLATAGPARAWGVPGLVWGVHTTRSSNT